MAKQDEAEPQGPNANIEKPRAARRDEGARDEDDDAKWDVIDEAAYESFPASDPPSYAGHAHDEPKKKN